MSEKPQQIITVDQLPDNPLKMPPPHWQGRANKRRFSQQHVVEVLSKRKITLLGQYRNSSAPMTCQCDVCSHMWQARFANIVHQNQGCPKCAGRIPKTRVDYEKLAAAHKGHVLIMAQRTENASVWVCKDGHEFSRSYENIRATGTFCTICSGWHPKKLSDYESLAGQFGGQIKKAASNVNKPSVWVCSRGHEFRRAYIKIDELGRFCPVCSARLGERLCRAAAELLFGVPFRKVKLKGLRGTRGGYLELDAFNEDLRLAIEHHGVQHFEPVGIWGGSEQLKRQQEHDRLRREYCRERGIVFIEIRELGVITPIEGLKDYIKKECLRQGMAVPPNYDSIKIYLTEIGLKPDEEKLFDRFKSQVAQKGWRVLSPSYLGSQACHMIRCERGHIFRSRPYQTSTMKVCPVCRELQRSKPVNLSDGRIFPSIAAAARKLGVSRPAVGYAIKHQTKCCGLHVST